jgi:4-hydroxy-3-methylbut-2-enyl diphosphate reductase
MKKINLILAAPRGFCAGVDRAIEIVERAIKIYGAPIYVRHEIVHNKYVVEDLKSKGAVFVKETDQVPLGAIVIFSAHGVAKVVEENAVSRNLQVIDATCPLVTKVHSEAIKFEQAEKELIVIGHHYHPEVEGTSGRVKQQVKIVGSVDEAKNIKVKTPNNLAYVTQTTLSVRDTKEIIDILKQRFPTIEGPELKDICYATQNRQNAVVEITKKAKVVLVVGAKNSSNSNRLKDLAIENGSKSYLINTYKEIDLAWFEGVNDIGLTAGASAPELLVEEVIEFLKQNFTVNLKEIKVTQENVKFKLPKQVA